MPSNSASPSTSSAQRSFTARKSATALLSSTLPRMPERWTRLRPASFDSVPNRQEFEIMTDTELQLRNAIIDKCRWMNASGLNQGTSGNISARHGDTMLISPSATPYDIMTPEMVAAMPIGGEYGAWQGPLKPSTEWRFHLDIMKARPEVGGIVHTHATYSTVLAIARKEIPACHYMVAVFGGANVRVAGYARFGTK